MELNLQRFFDACDPSRTLVIENAEDRQYYIDFASVRGGKVIEALKRTITRLSPYKPTCQLFTGHIGCGKSTELLRLKAELENQGFHVVYFESTEDLDETDVDITDILLAIARQVSKSLEESNIHLEPKGFKAFLQGVADFLQTPIVVNAEAGVPGVGTFEASSEGELAFSLPMGIGRITTTTKNSQQLRSKLRQHLEPQTTRILQFINQEILEVATKELRSKGKKGLVVIIDNLDRIDNRPLPSGRLQPEYLFVDRGDQLRKLNCHLVYTIPLALIFSNEREAMKNRLGGGIDPKMLPMVAVQSRTGEIYKEGLELLRQLILAKAFPGLKPQERLKYITEVFDDLKTLDRLCRVSGGHIRNLLGMVYRCIQEQDPPISINTLERIIREARDRLLLAIDDREWELLFKVVEEQKVKGEEEYQLLLRSMFVFEYRDDEGNWFGINPLLLETSKYKLWQKEFAKRNLRQ